jgi:hypothetical protein
MDRWSEEANADSNPIGPFPCRKSSSDIVMVQLTGRNAGTHFFFRCLWWHTHVFTDALSSGTSTAKKIGIGIVLVAIIGVAGTMYNGGKSSTDMAVKSAGIEVAANGKLKLFDAESK